MPRFWAGGLLEDTDTNDSENMITRLTPDNIDSFLSDDNFAVIRVWESDTSLSPESIDSVSKYSETVRFAVLDKDLFQDKELPGKITLEAPSVQLVQDGKVFHKINGTVRDNITKVNIALTMNT